MKKSQVIFKMIDIFMKEPQNAVFHDDVFCEKDIVYSDKGGEYTMGDIYYKPSNLRNGKKYPVVLNMHGGGFIMGDKKYRQSISHAFAHEDCFVFNINYRMPPEVDLMQLIGDTVDAFNYLGTLAEAYNIDLDRIIVTGDSSGAYNAAYLQALDADPDLAEKIGVDKLNYKIAMAMLFCGPYDLPRFMQIQMPFGIVPEMANLILDFPVDKDMSNVGEYPLYDYISPINFVNENWCPTFITWAKNDFLVPEQGVPMSEKLTELVQDVETYEAVEKTSNHCYHLFLKTSASKKCLDAVFAYLRSHMFGEEPAKAE